MTTIQRTLSILAMAAFVGLACNTTDAMARGNHDKHNNKRIVHVEKKVVKHVVRHKAPRYVVRHRAPHYVAHHNTPRPFGISVNNGHVSVSLPGFYFR